MLLVAIYRSVIVEKLTVMTYAVYFGTKYYWNGLTSAYFSKSGKSIRLQRNFCRSRISARFAKNAGFRPNPVQPYWFCHWFNPKDMHHTHARKSVFLHVCQRPVMPVTAVTVWFSVHRSFAVVCYNVSTKRKKYGRKYCKMSMCNANKLCLAYVVRKSVLSLS